MNKHTMFMRKALLPLLALLPLMAIAQLPVQTNLLTGYVGDYGVAPQAGINCTLTLVSPNPRTFNQTFITIAPMTVQSDTNGYFAFTNILWGNYLLSIQGQSYNEIFKIQVQTTTTNTTPLASLGRTFNPSWPNPQTNYYTMPQIDALLSALSAASGTGGVSVAALTGISAVTNGGLVSLSTPAVTNGDTRDISLQGKITGTNGAISFGPTVGITGNAESGSFSPALQMTRPNGAFSTVLLNSATNWLFGNNIIAPFFIGDGSSLSNYSATNLVGIIQTNSVRGAPTLGYVPAIQSDGYLTWVAQTGGGSGVTNNQVLPGIPSTTNGSFAGTFTGNLQQVINVTQPPFNAPSDGSADAAAGINAAITYQHTNGGSVYMPPGQYQLQSKLKLYANTPNPGSGSGNIGNVTNSFRLYGDKEHTLLWSTNLTSGNLIEFVSVNGDTNLQGAELDHFKLYGAGYNPANYPNNGGTVSSNYTVNGIFIGQPGVNSGLIGASYARIHDVTVEWCQCAIVFSNVVSMHVDHCNLQMNSTADIIDAHDDTCHINDNFLGITGYPNFATNHYAIWLIGTGAGYDTGNGQLIENNECDGQMLYADHTVALKYVGSDVEDGTGNNSTPYAFVLNGNCQGQFSVIRNNFTWANNTNRFIFHFINPNNQNAIKVTLPSTVSTAVPRKNWFRIDDSNQTVCHATELPEVDIGGSQGQFSDTADLITCLFNTNTWMSVPTSRMLPWRSGSNPTTIGGSQNLGVEVISNTPKSGMIMGWRQTNGTPQTATAAIGILSGDLNLLGYLGLSASDTLSFGYNPNGGGAVGPTAIQFDTASTYGGAPVPALIIDTQQSAHWQSNVFTAGITTTNGETNLSWTASTVLMADANRGSKSIPNATGWLHNDGAGNVTYSTPSGGTGLPGTNQIAVYGSAANVNGFGSFGSIDLIASNATGNATFAGGNQTNTGALSIGGTFAGNASGATNLQAAAARNVWNYGAFTNTATDQTAAIQSAINAAQTNGGTVFLPAGQYQINGTLYLSNNVSLIGANATYSSSGAWLHKVGAGAIVVPTSGQCNIRNVYFDGGMSAWGIGCTNVNGTSNWTIENCRFYGLNHGIWLNNAWNVNIYHSYATGCGDGLLFSNTVNTVKIIGGAFNANTNGIRITGGSCFTYFISADMESNVTGISMDQSPVNVKVTASQLEANTNSICATNVIGLSLDACTLESLGTNVWLIGTRAKMDGGYLQGAMNIYGDSASTLIKMSPYVNSAANADSFAGNLIDLSTNAYFSAQLTAAGITNNGVGATGIVGTDSHGYEKKVALSGLTYDGTTLTASGSYYGPFTNLTDWSSLTITDASGNSLTWTNGTLTADTITTSNFNVTGNFYTGKTNVFILGTDSNSQLITNGLTAGANITLSYAQNASGGTNVTIASTAGGSAVVFTNATVAYSDLHQTNGFGAFVGLDIVISNNLGSAVFVGGNQTNTGTLKALAFVGSGASLTSLNASQLTSGTVPVGVLPGPLQLLSTNHIGAVTNAYGQYMSNAIQGIIAGGGLSGTTNQNVVTLTATGIQTNGGSGIGNYLTNLTTVGSTNYGDKYETNALVVNNGGVTISNNLGSVFSTGGNTTNTGSVKAGGDLAVGGAISQTGTGGNTIHGNTEFQGSFQADSTSTFLGTALFGSPTKGQITSGGQATLDLGPSTNINAGAITGYVHTVTYDLSSAWPGDTLPATWSTNTPGPYSTNLQSAGPTFKAYAVSVTGTNNLLLQCDVPEYYGGGAVTAAVCVVSGTNANITGAHDITNVFALSGAVYGTALGTAQVMTNNLALGTGTISTNWAWPNGITIAGTVTKSQPVIFQLQSWGGSPYWTSTNNEWAISLKVTWPLTNAQYNTISVP